uniref:Capsid scaffolding protein n=2 Tax=Meleagrid herpesvirus 1 TaxID=37108 RepID=Q9E1G6_MEHV1|nr:UL26 [Meleagrid alphaherpesvirus 1]
MKTNDHPAVYVAGYLTLYGAKDNNDLVIDRNDIRAAIPTPSPLPINIDHRQDCVVGAVLALADDDHGLFFVGRINCPLMTQTLEAAASQEIFSELENISKDEKLLYLVTNYLPSVSLSSRRLEPGERADETFFSHVALCLLGKRIGTIVTYDFDVDHAIQPFTKLSDVCKSSLISEAIETEKKIGPTVWNPSKSAITKALLATAINNMLLRDKWRIISERRRLAGIVGQKYLQASALTALDGFMTSDNGSKSIPSCESVNPETVQREGIQECDTPMLSGNETIENTLGGKYIGRPPICSSTSELRDRFCEIPSENLPIMSSQSPRPPGDDFIWVPIKSYNQLVSRYAQHSANNPDPVTNTNQQLYIPPTMPSTGQSPFYSGYGQYGHPLPSYSSPFSSGCVQYSGIQPHPVHSGQTSLEAKLSALLDCMNKDKRQMDEGYRYDGVYSGQERRARKRPYAFDKYDESDLCYPGELSRHEPHYEGEGKNVGPSENRRDSIQTKTVLSGLMGAVTSLQREVERLNGERQYTQPYAAVSNVGSGLPARYYCPTIQQLPHPVTSDTGYRAGGDDGTSTSGKAVSTVRHDTGTDTPVSGPAPAIKEQITDPNMGCGVPQDTVDASAIAGLGGSEIQAAMFLLAT